MTETPGTQDSERTSAAIGAPRPKRRAEEDIPSADYARRMRKLGPRKGESLLAYRMRMAATEEGREMWKRVWQQYENVEDCARALGVHPGSAGARMRQVGLSASILKEITPATGGGQ